MINTASARDALVNEWFDLTRGLMPSLAKERDWPVRFDHCFQRILLDHACQGPWRASIEAPAYRNAPPETLRAAIVLGRAVVEGDVNLSELNRQSLAWRGKS